MVPVLSEAGYVYEVIITQRAHHAQQMMTSLCLDNYRAIAVVAGDGLLYEVSLGFYETLSYLDVLTLCLVNKWKLLRAEFFNTCDVGCF